MIVGVRTDLWKTGDRYIYLNLFYISETLITNGGEHVWSRYAGWTIGPIQ